ncbi:Cmx/CmrA family chloramphenicol efflux MFS transporter [Sciscionella sediminilitoris]|uniref:Cmx/CmrA family chloramphenicol efflux MFS transporter n=1 Tax=Sciscionella sediminilitoris TaxID=1445613 RepID=UPI00056CB9A1|nr:Cmx/CmrA family chloramphenicol efflux MFS transporter [Sciscionella sp. SE31]
MHRGVYVLALSVFALGTTEFMISGLLPGMARDLGVSVSAVGGLIAAFAIGMVVGAPVMAALTLRWPRKATLLGALAVFVLGHVVAGFASDYSTLVVARVVTAVATGAFWAVGGTVVVRLAGPGKRARGLAVFVGGLTVANVLGVPLGTVIGEGGGWRGAFFAVAGAALVAMLGVLALVPRLHTSSGGAQPNLRAELRVFRQPRAWVALGTISLTGAAIFGTFSYLSPFLVGVSGFTEGIVPLLLAVFGVGAVIGLQVAGRFADSHPFASLFLPLAALALVLAALGLFGENKVLAIVAVGLLGFAGFGANPALLGRMFSLAGEAPTLANSMNVSAFNIGNTVGPLVGGAVIDAGLGYPTVPVVGAGIVVLALLAGFGSLLLDRRIGAPEPQQVEHRHSEDTEEEAAVCVS